MSKTRFVTILVWAFLSCAIVLPADAEVATFNNVGIQEYYSGPCHFRDPNPFWVEGHLFAGYDPVLDQCTNSLYIPGHSDGILDVEGFRFAGEHFHIINAPAIMGFTGGGGFPDNGTAYIAEEEGCCGRPFTMTSLDGRTFSLLSFDGAETFVNVEAAAAHENHYLTSTVIRLTGKKPDGTALETSFPLDGLNDGIGPGIDFQTFFLPADWTNLTSVTFNGFYADSAPGGISVDNINVIKGQNVVTIDGRTLLMNGVPFTIKGIVYSPVPTGDDPRVSVPYGDYFTVDHTAIYSRDLPLLRKMGTNTVRIMSSGTTADHQDFLDKAYNEGSQSIRVIADYRIEAGMDIAPGSPSNVREQIKTDFRQMVAMHKNHPAILMWCIGSDLNAPSMYGDNLDNLFSLINEMAEEAHTEEGVNYHPVTTALADIDLMSTIASYETSLPALDLWGANIYRGSTFGTLFDDFSVVSSKPLIILEYGIDAYDTASGNEYEFTGSAHQADYAASLWGEMENNSDICIGGSIMEYSDEWWKGDVWSDEACSDSDPAYHGLCGFPDSAHPDGYSNVEWWGIMRPVRDEGNPDTMEPRIAYSRLQSLWAISLDINNGNPFTRSTSSTLTIICADPSLCLQMQFSNDAVTWSAPAAYLPSNIWALPAGDSMKTVYAKVRDAAGNWSDVFSDTIVLDTLVPVTTASPSGGSYTTPQSVALICNDTSSGCDKTYYTTDGTTPTTASNIYSVPIEIAAGITLKFFSKDQAGNAEGVRTQTYTFDMSPPTGTVVINGAATYTRSRSVTLALSCSDDRGCSQMQFSNDNITWTSPGSFAATRSWNLSAGDGEKTVYVKYRDAAGNWSDVFSDTIVLDTLVPVTTASPSGGSYTTPQSVALTCSDTRSGCDKTYYTTDGTTPTTASSVYAGPISVTTTTTLKFFSKDQAGNTESVKTQTYSMDTTPPTGTILISGGIAFTRYQTTTLNLSCSDNMSCSQMQFSNDNVTWSTPVTYAATRTWTMSTGNGEKTVYVRYRDAAGNWSDVFSDTIVLDTLVPVTTASPSGGSYTTPQSVALICNDTSSGCDKTYYTTDGTTPTTASNIYSVPIEIAAGITLKFFSKDQAGNTEGVRTQTYSIDMTSPTGAVVISGGAVYTKSRTVTLTFSCSDGTACFQVQLSNDSITWSTYTYSATRTSNLTAGNGEKTVYAKYRDTAGNWSDVYADTIILDMTAPTNGILIAAAEDGQVSLSWSGFSDALSGISLYTLVYSTETPPTSCSTGISLYSGPETSYIHTDIAAGTTYYYRVCATDNAGNTSSGVATSLTP